MKNIFKCFRIKICVIIFVVLFVVFIFVFLKQFTLVLNYLNTYSSAVLALVAILGLISGKSWIDTSKDKIRGKLDNDIARKYLKTVLQLRDAVKIARNPFISIGEMQDALEKNGFNAEEYTDNKKVNRSVYSLRWGKIQESWTNFEEILIDAEVSWGDEALNIQKDLDLLIRKLRSIIWLYVNYPEDFGKKGQENSKILYGTHDESDNFAQDINKEIEKIRIFLKKHL